MWASNSILVTGPPGCGKTTLVKTLKKLGIKATDLDTVGTSQFAVNGRGAWVVRQQSLRELHDQGVRVFVGSCDNMFRPVKVVRAKAGVSWNKSLEGKTYQPISSLDWAHKIYLWYDPNKVAERLNADDRRNEHNLSAGHLAQKISKVQSSLRWYKRTAGYANHEFETLWDWDKTSTVQLIKRLAEQTSQRETPAQPKRTGLYWGDIPLLSDDAMMPSGYAMTSRFNRNEDDNAYLRQERE